MLIIRSHTNQCLLFSLIWFSPFHSSPLRRCITGPIFNQVRKLINGLSSSTRRYYGLIWSWSWKSQSTSSTCRMLLYQKTWTDPSQHNSSSGSALSSISSASTLSCFITTMSRRVMCWTKSKSKLYIIKVWELCHWLYQRFLLRSSCIILVWPAHSREQSTRSTANGTKEQRTQEIKRRGMKSCTTFILRLRILKTKRNKLSLNRWKKEVKLNSSEFNDRFNFI